MEQYIPKAAVVAEIERRVNDLYPNNGQGMVVTKILKEHYKDLKDFIDTLEVKEVDDTEYWLVSVRYALNGCDTESNCFFAYFPAKQDIQNAIGAERYTILHIQNLTEEQFNKLTEREHGI